MKIYQQQKPSRCNSWDHIFSTLLLLLVSSTAAFAETEAESSVWLMSLSRARLGENAQAFLDLQPRTAVDSSTARADGDLRQLLVRGALGYDLSESVTLFQGYATIAAYEPTRVEHRSFQELLVKTDFSSFTWLHRVRFEQRFLEGVSGVSLRGRYFGRLTIPLNDTYSLVSNEEAFFHLNDRSNGPQAGFDQNRLLLGLNRKVSESVSIDLGYQNQFIQRRGGVADIMNHILFFGVFTSFDFS